MLNIIENYKKLFTSFVKNDFTTEVPAWAEEPKPFDWDAKSDLKKLQEYIQSWNQIDSNEAKIISDNLSEINDEAREWLKEVADSMLKEWFSAADKQSYESFQKIIEKWGSNQKLPTWSQITNALRKDNFFFVESSFGGITIKWDQIKVRYDKVGTRNTLNMSYKPEWDNVKLTVWDWANEAWDQVRVKSKSTVDKWLLTDNLDALDSKEIWAQLDALSLEIKSWETKEKLEAILEKVKALKDIPEDLKAKYDWLITTINTKIIAVEKVRVEKEKEAKAKAIKDAKEAKFNSADKYNENRFKTKLERQIIQTLVWTWVDGDFGEKTYDKIVEKQKELKFDEAGQDGKIWPSTLRKMLPEETKVTIEGKEYSVSVSEKGELAYETESVVDNVVDSVESWYESAKDVLKSGLKILSDFLRINDELKTFIWENWESVDIEFNEATKSFDIDTSFWDGVSDKEMNKMILSLDWIDKIKDNASAEKFAKEKVGEIKAMYDKAAIKSAIDSVDWVWGHTSTTVSTFKDNEGVDRKIQLVKNVDSNDKFKEIKVKVATDMFWDWISDSDTEVIISKTDRKITEAELNKAIKESQKKYEDKAAEVAEDELEEKKADEAKEAAEKKASDKEAQLKKEAAEKKASEEAAEKKEKEDIKEIKSEISKLKLTATDIKPKWVDENKWVKWTSEFSTSPEFGLDINDIDMKANKINIDFDDSWPNESFNKGLIINWAIDKDWKLNVDAFKKALPIKVTEAIKKMIALDDNKKK